MTQYYFIRHGECQANADQMRAGWLDSPLTSEGITSASSEAVRLAEEGMKFDMIVSSPLSRAYDTAKIIAHGVGYDSDGIIVINQLKERGFGGFEGRLLSDLPPGGFDEIVASGGESLDEFIERVHVALANIKQLSTERQAKNVLIVSHAGWYRMATALLEEGNVDEFYLRPGVDNNCLVSFSL